MKKLLFITPHLSTGGQPQYLYKQIESLINDYDIYCIEWENVTGGVLVVQRNKIESLLGKKLITLGKHKDWILNQINSINPDIIHMQELPEYFIPYEIATRIYKLDRKYKIIETSHDSGFDITNKVHFPDKFLMVSNYQVDKFLPLGVPTELVEYPIEYKVRTKSREDILNELGLDPNLKHVINVGLFTPRKNQSEIVEYAKQLKGYPIQFHFIGNHADNFKNYWEPIMNDFPENCKWWGERSDVDTFYQMADLFLFTSRGSATDRETMPLVIREAIGWKVPSLIFNLDVYLNYFDKYETINYLDFNSKSINCEKIVEILGLSDAKNLIEENVDTVFDIHYLPTENKITFNYKKQEKQYYKITIKDKDSNAPIYWFDVEFSNYMGYWCIPSPLNCFDFYNEPSFSSFLIEFYSKDNKLLFSKDIFVKNASKKRNLKLDIVNNFDCLFNNYNEMFVENKYDCYELDNLDTVLDLGANNGLFSLMLLNKGAKNIYSFEPNQESLLNLKHMFRNNANVSIIEKAVYINDNDLEFFVDPSNTTIGSISKEHLESNGTGIEKITVPAISLKTFIEQNSIKSISLVKMDIEGAEYDIIDSLDDESFSIIDSFLIEWHDNYDGRVNRLISKLKSKGYNIEQIRNQNDKDNKEITYTYSTETVGTFLAKRAKLDDILTVVIPAYNHEKYIEQCINSVISQKTLFNFQIVISDDCSNDSTFDIISKYNNYYNIKIHKTDSNEGPTPIRIYNLIKDIKSKFVTILDADDYYLDEYKLQKQVDFLKNNSEYSIHATEYLISKDDAYAYGADGSSELYMSSTMDDVELKNNLDANYIGFGYMFNNSYLKNKSFPSWFFDKDVFDAYWALINLLLEYGKAKNEKWIGGRYRITPNGQFGEKDEQWKADKIKTQSNVYKAHKKNQTKPIIIVDAFFHDKHCYTTFKNYLEFIKPLGLPIMLVTNSNFEQDLIKEVDYVFYDSNNRLFEKKYEHVNNIVFWYSDSNHYFSMGTAGFQKHGLSVLSNIYHSTNLAKSLGYTHFYRIEYDCTIDKPEKIKDIIETVFENDKKGLVYINENRYVSFQVWYFELEWFTKWFPKINSEEDYVYHKQFFNYDRDFISAEEFIYNMIKTSDKGFDNVIVKDAPFMHTDFGECNWNTVMTPLESEKIVDGYITSVHKVTDRSDSQLQPELCSVNTNQIAIITWNCSSSNQNTSDIKIVYPSGLIRELQHTVTGINAHKVEFIDLLDDDIHIEITLNNKFRKNFIVNKKTVYNLNDVYQKNN